MLSPAARLLQGHLGARAPSPERSGTVVGSHLCTQSFHFCSCKTRSSPVP